MNTTWIDLLAAIFMLVGSLFTLAAAVGLVRFPDVLARMHSATKPQVFGLIIMMGGVILAMRTWHALFLLTFVVLFQILTAPVSGHMVARAAYRTGQWNSHEAVLDELAEDLTEAGFERPSD